MTDLMQRAAKQYGPELAGQCTPELVIALETAINSELEVETPPELMIFNVAMRIKDVAEQLMNEATACALIATAINARFPGNPMFEPRLDG